MNSPNTFGNLTLLQMAVAQNKPLTRNLGSEDPLLLKKLGESVWQRGTKLDRQMQAGCFSENAVSVWKMGLQAFEQGVSPVTVNFSHPENMGMQLPLLDEPGQGDLFQNGRMIIGRLP